MVLHVTVVAQPPLQVQPTVPLQAAELEDAPLCAAEAVSHAEPGAGCFHRMNSIVDAPLLVSAVNNHLSTSLTV